MSPTSGTGTGTAVVCGVPGTGMSVAEPLKYTLLSLPYYARIMGIDPVHFQGAYTSTVFPSTSCDDFWPRYAWQYGSRVSHDDLARAIYDAEQDIARELGYYPAPYWIAQEQHKYPQHHRRDVYSTGGINVRGQRKSITTRFSKIIQGGQRAVYYVNTATCAGGSLAYSDEDGDGFAETATVELTTTFTDACELKVYFTGTEGAQEWEIRPARSKTISDGTFTAVFPSWLFIDPDLQTVYPDVGGFDGVDITTTANYVTSVDVYREYNNYGDTGATFFWEPKPSNTYIGGLCTACGGDGCPACSLTSQDGCLGVRDVERGIVVPAPATYSEDDAAWSQSCFTECRDPDMVSLYYYAGEYDHRYLQGYTCEPLSNYWAHAIAWLATARLDREFCGCTNVVKWVENLRTDLALVGEKSYQLNPDLVSNPFGTRRGAVMAWQRVAKVQGRQIKGGAI